MELDIFNDITGFEWDDGNISHIAVHNVLPNEAEEIFFDKNNLLDEDIKHSSVEEKRFIIIGKTKKRRILYQVFTLRNNNIRVISSRDIRKRKEMKLYEKETSNTEVSK